MTRDNEKKKAYEREYYSKNKERAKERATKWAKNNPEKYKARMQQYYIKRREQLKEYSRENYNNRPLVSRWAYHTIKAHQHKGMVVNVTRERLVEIATGQGKCQICGVELKFYKGGRTFCKDSVTLDRLNNGSMIDESNMLIICSECNMTKGTRKFKDFLDYCKMITERDWSEYGF